MGTKRQSDLDLLDGDDLELLGDVEEPSMPSGRGGGGGRGAAGVAAVGAQPASRGELKTTIINTAEVYGQRPTLVIQSGPDAGKRFTIDKDRISIGRATDNECVLHDLAVSRRHVHVVNRGESFALIDQGSGNGSKVNGVRVTDVDLHHGDEISIGNTVLRYEYPIEKEVSQRDKTQVFPPISQISKLSPEPSPSAKMLPLIMYGGGGLVALLAVAVVLKTFVFTGAATPEQKPVSEKGSLVTQQVTDGIAAFNSRRYEEAQNKFIAALTLDPNFKAAQDWLEKTKLETERGKNLKQARDEMERRNYREAGRLLKAIPSDVNDSGWATEANDLRKRIDDVLRGKLADAREMWDRGNASRALNFIEEVQAIDPDNREARDLKSMIDRDRGSARAAASDRGSGGGGGREVARAPRDSGGSARSGRSSGRSTGGGGGGGGGSSVKGFDSVISTYSNKGVFQAIGELKSSPNANSRDGKLLMDRMKSFQSTYSKAQLFATRGGSEAVSLLNQAAKLDKQISPRGSQYTSKIQSMLAQLR